MPSGVDTAALTRGHKKKARTRQHLLDAALRVLAERGEGFTVSDVVVRAEVSPGTFYNYFVDREELVDALVPHVVESFAARSADTVDEVDPAARFALITARALGNALHRPDVMRVALRLEAVQRALLVAGPLSYLRQDLVAGHSLGRFADPPDDGTLDVIVGAILFAARRILDGETGPDYRRSVITQLLRGLGLGPVEAADLATRAVERDSDRVD